jgi:hypothetical protein
MNAHEKAVNAALDANDKLGAIFDGLGNASNPHGSIVRLYRMARAALLHNLQNEAAALDTLRTLREQLYAVIGNMLTKSEELGRWQAEKQLAALGIAPVEAAPIAKTDIYAALMSAVDAQLQGAAALILSGTPDISLLLGDDTRAGIVTPGVITVEAAKWAAILVGMVFRSALPNAKSERGADVYVRQAVAAIDERTTDCCLRVNGQIATLDGDFTLTGTPRFADHVHAPPFHWNCRTATALVRADAADDALTRSMREAARAELNARQDGSRKEIHPAHARSRR